MVKVSSFLQVCADFEDSSLPQEKFFHWTPVKLDDLPAFRLCHPRYWEESLQSEELVSAPREKPQMVEIGLARAGLGKL